MRKLTALFALSLALSMQAQQHVMTVDVSKPTAKIQPEMYGIFFEDINFGADGGLYAELVKNRSFEFPQPFVGWVPFGNVTVQFYRIWFRAFWIIGALTFIYLSMPNMSLFNNIAQLFPPVALLILGIALNRLWSNFQKLM